MSRPNSLRSKQCFFLLLAMIGATGIAQAKEGVQVGKQKQLLVDDHVVAEAIHVERVLQSASKANDSRPIRFWTKDAEGQRKELKAWIYASPYYDEQRGIFRMWSRVL